MNDRYLLTIIIPVYNTSAYLRECLESVLQSSSTQYEVLVINDGSTDNSLSILNEYAKRHSNLTVLSQSNSGLSASRNRGIMNSNGTYIMFVDSDDSLLEGSVDYILDYLNKNCEEDIDVFRIETTIQQKEESNIYYDKNDFINMFLCQKAKNWPAVLYIAKKEIIKKNNIEFRIGFLHEDVLWTTQLLLVSNNAVDLGFPCYIQRENRKGSITSTPNPKRLNDIVDLSFDAQNMVMNSDLNFFTQKMIMSRLTQATTSLIWLYYYMDTQDRRRFNKQYDKFLSVINKGMSNKSKAFSSLIKIIGFKTSMALLSPILRK